MFLNNKLFHDDICNGTIGIITEIIDNTNVEVTFLPSIRSQSKKKPPTLISTGREHQDKNSHSRTPSPSLYTKYKVSRYLT